MAKKTYNQKLNDNNGMPRVEDMSDKPDYVTRYGGNKMLIAAPSQYNELMARVPEGKLVSAEKIRAYLAGRHDADVTCPLTAGIFINICAHAAEERGDASFPWWRTVKAKGELNEKYPGGTDSQRQRLEAEGHEVVQKGKRFFVNGYEEKLWEVE